MTQPDPLALFSERLADADMRAGNQDWRPSDTQWLCSSKSRRIVLALVREVQAWRAWDGIHNKLKARPTNEGALSDKEARKALRIAQTEMHTALKEADHD